MTTIIGLLIVFLAILFTISLTLSAIGHFIQLNRYSDYNRSTACKKRSTIIIIRVFIVAVLYTLLFYWYF